MISFPSQIRVGLTCDGIPRLHREGNCYHLENLLIGNGFHWQKSISALLPGLVEVIPDKNLVVNTLPVEDYLECVVGSEMNPSAPSEFLKAHAIISRSWALRMILNPAASIPDDTLHDDNHAFVKWEDCHDHLSDPFDVCSDDHCQRYQGLQPVSPEATYAIRSTAGMILTDNDGNVVDARFSKCCGGRTELFSTCWQNIDYPYLQSFEDPYCDLSSLDECSRNKLLSAVLKPYDFDSRDHDSLWGEWSAEMNLDELRSRIIDKYHFDPGNIRSISPLKKGPSGRISLLRIEGENGYINIGKELSIRRLLAHDCLLSSAFTPHISNNRLIMRGRGWGHGVGLCQIGAARMAIDGHPFSEILSFYYPDAKISNT